MGEANTPRRDRDPAPADPQARTNTHFDTTALYWRDIYDDPSLQGVIYRERQQAVLERVAELRLSAGARVLELGCGAGLLTVELARRGYAVQAVDASISMVELTERRLAEADLTARCRAQAGDVHRLSSTFEDFALVIAVGLLPWLHQPDQVLAEIARVLQPGGHLVLTADNRARLSTLVDPRANVLLTPLKRLRRRLRPRTVEAARSRLHFPSHVNAMVRSAGFELDRTSSVGFGPFSLWGRPLFSDATGIRLHCRLQALADRGVPVVRLSGWHYLLSAHKRTATSSGEL